ncbi:MAG: PaaI family thioesterase [Rhodospirillaceae bacterium]|nr:PaaI family thioesterase [Rhodospirillaceae bacterium]
MSAVPAGFVRLPPLSPYIGAMGPFYVKDEATGRVLGLEVQEKHLNTRGFVHGAVVCGLADIAIAINLADEARLPVVTANLSVDFAGTAALGDWIECRVDLQRQGRRLAFANAYIWRGGERIVRASGVFARPAGG